MTSRNPPDIGIIRRNPPDLTGEQRTSLAEIADTNRTLYRAYLLKEQLREVFRVKGPRGRQLLAGWLSWASHSRIPEFSALCQSLRASSPCWIRFPDD